MDQDQAGRTVDRAGHVVAVSSSDLSGPQQTKWLYTTVHLPLQHAVPFHELVGPLRFEKTPLYTASLIQHLHAT